MFAENTVQMPVQQFVKNTKWYNPTDNTVTIELHVKMPLNVRKATAADPLTYEERTGNIKVSIPAKGEIMIPSVYDRAIQYVRDGVIQSGAAPQLQNKGAKEIPRMHPSLDTAEADRKMAELTIAKAIEAQAATEIKYQAALDELNRLRDKDLSAKRAEDVPSATSAGSASESTETSGRMFVPPPPKKKD